jgi:hypothetical protein
MPCIPDNGWALEYDCAADGGMAALFGVARPRGSRSLASRAARYLRAPSSDPWDHRLMREGGDKIIDAVLHHLLEGHGVRPEAMLLLSLMGATPELRHGILGDDTSLMPHDNDGVRVRGIAWIGRGIRWDSLGDEPFVDLRRHEMPEALAVAATGRPLHDLVSHPKLDGLDLVIDRIEKPRWGPRIYVRNAGIRMMSPPGGGEKETARC